MLPFRGLIALSIGITCLCLVFQTCLWGQGRGPGDPVSDDTLFLTGKVVQNDNSAPSEPVQLDLYCGGRVQQQVYTSEDGAFSFKIERQQPQKWMDASVGNDAGLNDNSHWNSSIDKQGVFAASRFKTFNMNGCRIRLSTGQKYVATSVPLGSRSVFDNPDIGVIVISAADSAGPSTIGVTTLSAPKQAREAYQKGLDELEKGHDSKALGQLEKAVKLYDRFAEAWQAAGEIHLKRNDPQAARKAFTQANIADPQFTKPYLSLARLALYTESWGDAARVTDRLIALEPGSPQGNYYNGLAYFFLHDADKAERALLFIKSSGLGPDYPIALLHLGVIHAQKGKIASAAEEWEAYLRYMPEKQMPPGQKEKLEQKLTRWREQGLLEQPSVPKEP